MFLPLDYVLILAQLRESMSLFWHNYAKVCP